MTAVSATAHRLDILGRATIAGALAGLVALGAGSRAAMRLVALTSGRIGTGVRPESDAVPGTITLGGTVFLLLAGAFVGATVAVVLVALVGRWLPAGRWSRWWAVVALATPLPAVLLLDPDNGDFRLFGPRALAVGLFALPPVAFGALLATMLARWERWRTSGAVRGVRLLVGVGGGLLGVTSGLGSGLGVLTLLPVLVLVGIVAGVEHGPAGTAGAGIGRAATVVLVVAAVVTTVGRIVAVAVA